MNCPAHRGTVATCLATAAILAAGSSGAHATARAPLILTGHVTLLERPGTPKPIRLAAADLQRSRDARLCGRTLHLQLALPLGVEAAAPHEHLIGHGDREVEARGARRVET